MVSKSPKVRVIRPAPPLAIFHNCGVVRLVADRKADMSTATTPPRVEPGAPFDLFDWAAELERRTGKSRAEGERLVADLAESIVGAGRRDKDWLRRGLQKAAAGIGWTIRKAAEHPRREDLRGQFQSALDAARLLRDRLTDTSFLGVLAASAQDDPFGDQAYSGLGLLIEHLEKAVSAIPRGRNRHKYHPGSNSPNEVCALTIAFAWHPFGMSCHDILLGSRRRHVKDCGRWQVVRRAGHGGNQTLSGWRTHLQRANRILASEDRPEIARCFDLPTP